MRNLKKILALVLALMMVLSMMVTASATTFVDDADITAKYAEAVSVLAGIGVLRGNPTGTEGEFAFNPQGALNRAQAATIISYIKLGTLEGIEETVAIYENPFNDVADWAIPYVLYAHSEEIIIGRNATTFDPNATITGYEFGKMLLIAAGLAKGSDFVETAYVVNGVQYTNETLAMVAAMNSGANIEVKTVGKSDWQVIVASGLKDADIWASEFALSKKLTREEACYLAFNTMNKSALMTSVFPEAGKVAEGELAADDFGRPETNKWLLNTTPIYVTYAEPVATVYGHEFDHDSTANAKVYDFDTKTPTIVFNGGTSTDFDTLDELEVPGVTIELFGEYNKTSKLYEIETVVAYAYELATVKNVTKTAITLTVGATDVSIAAPAEGAQASELYAHVSAYNKGDVLSVIAKPGYDTDEANLTILESEVADSVYGTVTATGAGYYRVDGNKKVNGALANTFATTIGTTVGDFYLDPNGFVLGYVLDDGTFDVDTDYVYVLAQAAKAADAASSESDGLFGSVATSDATAAVAKLIIVNLATGEISQVDKGIVCDENGDYFYADQYGRVTDVPVTDVPAEPVNKFYKYTTLADGSYVLIEDVTTADVTLDKGKTEILTGKNVITTTSTTMINILVQDKDADSTAEYTDTLKDIKVNNLTGAASFPKTDASAGTTKYEGDALVIADANTGIVSKIVVVELNFVPTAKDTSFNGIYVGAGETDALGTKHGFMVAGEYVEYYIVSGALDSAEVGKLHTVTVNPQGKVKAAAVATAEDSGEIVYVDDSMILIGTKTYTLNSSKLVVVDKTAQYAVSELEEGVTVELYDLNDSKTDKIVYAIITAR